MRVSLVSHTYVAAANRKKLAALGMLPQLQLQVIVPDRWPRQDFGTCLQARDECDQAYQLSAVRPLWMRHPGYVFTPSMLWRQLRQFHPDTLHLEEEPWSPIALQLAMLKGIAYKRLVLFTWENLKRRYPPPCNVIRRLVLRRADHIVVGNREAADLLQRQNVRAPMIVIPQIGVDTPSQMSSEASAGQSELVVGYVGRIVEAKGIKTLIEAVAKLRKGWRVCLVGDGALVPTLQQQAQTCGVSLEITGAVAHEVVSDYMRRLDVLVLPSQTPPRWKEQFGHVLIEAMGAGLPVVGSTSGAIPEVIGEAGLVFPEGDATALAQQLDALRCPRRRQELGQQGIARVQDCFTHDRIASQVYDVYQSVHTNGERSCQNLTRSIIRSPSLSGYIRILLDEVPQSCGSIGKRYGITSIARCIP